MRLQAYNDNGTMKFRQVSGSEAIDSLPVGTTIGYEGGVIPNGYLLCDGSTFDTAKYPELYTLLGTDTLPELFDHSKPSNYETFTGNNASAQYDGEISAVGTTGDSAQVAIRILINGNVVMLGGNQFVGCGAISFKKGDTISYSALRTTPIFYVRYYKQHLLIKAATIGISDVSMNAVKTALVGISGKLVWTNPSPTSSFGAQDIILSVPITGYDFIKIEHTIMAGGRQVDTYYIESGGAGIQDVVFASGPNITCSNRTFSFVDDTTVHFGTASSVAVAAQAANAAVNNGRTIPTRIWLCKQFRED